MTRLIKKKNGYGINALQEARVLSAAPTSIVLKLLSSTSIIAFLYSIQLGGSKKFNNLKMSFSIIFFSQNTTP